MYHDDRPDTWRPDLGDKLTGELTRISQVTTRYGAATVAVIKTNDGHYQAVFLTKVLQRKFDEHDPQIGDSISIEFLGMRTPKQGRYKYRDYKVEFDLDDGDGRAADLDRFGRVRLLESPACR